MSELGFIDYTAVGVSLITPALVSLFYGLTDSRPTNRADNVGRTFLGLFPINMSIVASIVSGMSLIGFPIEIYQYGIDMWLYFVLTQNSTALLSNYLLLPVLYNLPLQSSYQYFELRFDMRVRKLASFIYVIYQIGFAAIAVYPAGIVVSQYLKVSPIITVHALALFCTIFAALGGFKGVVWADTYQAIMMWIFLAMYFVVAVVLGGGPVKIFKAARDSGRLRIINLDLDPTQRLTLWSGVFGGISIFSFSCVLNPSYYQRLSALKTECDARKAVMISTSQLGIITTILATSGLSIYSTFQGCDPKSAGIVNTYMDVVTYFVTKGSEIVLGLNGLFIACVICASLSTMSTSLNTTAIVLYTEMIEYNRMKLILRNETLSTRVLTVVAGLLSMGFLLFVTGTNSLYESLNGFVGIVVGLTLGLFILGMFCLPANSRGSFWGGILGLCLTSCLSAGSRMYQGRTTLPSYLKPLSTELCPFNVTSPMMSTVAVTPPAIFRITSYLYAFISAIFTVSLGLFFSLLTKKSTDKTKLRSELFCPCVRRLFKNSFYVPVPVDDNPTTALDESTRDRNSSPLQMVKI